MTDKKTVCGLGVCGFKTYAIVDGVIIVDVSFSNGQDMATEKVIINAAAHTGYAPKNGWGNTTAARIKSAARDAGRTLKYCNKYDESGLDDAVAAFFDHVGVPEGAR